MEDPEGSEVTADDEGEGEGREGGKRVTLLALIIVGVIGLGGGGAMGGRILGPVVGEKLAQREIEGPADSRGGGHGEEASSVHIVDNLVANPAGSEGTRFLLASVAIQLNSPDDIELIVARDFEFRAALLLILGSKTVDELTDITMRMEIVDEILEGFEAITGPEIIHRIFIPQWVIQ